jgi:hypothetical protein
MVCCRLRLDHHSARLPVEGKRDGTAELGECRAAGGRPQPVPAVVAPGIALATAQGTARPSEGLSGSP